MVKFLYPRGIVYILENPEVHRVKVGMTGIGVNSVVDRIKDLNDMWLERKVTCQICGGRLVAVGGHVPQHVKSGTKCPGGGALPLERDAAMAESYLENMKKNSIRLFGTEKGSIVRRIKALEVRIDRYRQHSRLAGVWQLKVAFHTEGVAEIESLSHRLLEAHLDRQAPFGEVFCCSVPEATEAVEAALRQLGLTHSARKETSF